MFWTSALLSECANIAHGFTERHGGVSFAPFDSLNLGLHVGDAQEAVLENRRRAAWTLGFSREQMVCGEQIHGSRVAVVGRDDAGRGATEYADSVAGTDALVTDAPGLLLTLFFADCLPILLVNTKHSVVAVAHAGWRGLAGGVIENTVTVLRERFDSQPEDLIAAVGPGIGPCCFEVGEDLASRFGQDAHVGPTGKPHVDLPEAAKRRLLACGVPENQIEVARLCTSCLWDRFFSHRRDRGRTGRMGAFIGIRPVI